MSLKKWVTVSILSAALMLASVPSRPALSQASLADLSQLTLDDLVIQKSGSFVAPAPVVDALGYDPSRSWHRGQSVADVMTIGDFQRLALERLTLGDLKRLTGINPKGLRLSDVGVLGWQTVGDLVAAQPELTRYRISDVAPIADLLQAYGVSFVPENTVADILRERSLAALPLNSIDLNRYRLASVPHLEAVPLKSFRHWQRSTLGQVPGLRQVPLSRLWARNDDFPLPFSLVDIVFGSAENRRYQTVSGSYQEGFQVPCERECAHIELGQPYLGRQWISGKYQQVRGGSGTLATVNNGLEPTGRHPHGDDFKVVIWEVYEASGVAEQALFFRICEDFLGCTPYFIGPVLWFPVQEEGLILL